MNKESMNIELDGLTIVNAHELANYIDSLKYNFNTNEYLQSLYTMLLYSDFKNKDELLDCIKRKIEDFALQLNNNEEITFERVKYMMGNNEVDVRVYNYMSMLLDSMDYRIENGRNYSKEQILLDDYISYIRSLENISKENLDQIDKYDKITKKYEIKRKNAENFHRNSGLVTIILLFEILAIGLFLYLLV